MQDEAYADKVVRYIKPIDVDEHFRYYRMEARSYLYECQSIEKFIEIQTKVGMYFKYKGKYYDRFALLNCVERDVIGGEVDICTIKRKVLA